VGVVVVGVAAPPRLDRLDRFDDRFPLFDRFDDRFPLFDRFDDRFPLFDRFKVRDPPALPLAAAIAAFCCSAWSTLLRAASLGLMLIGTAAFGCSGLGSTVITLGPYGFEVGVGVGVGVGILYNYTLCIHNLLLI